MGDVVQVGDVLAEVETDKATMEMKAFDEGVLSEIYVQDGQKVEIGQKLALLAERWIVNPKEMVLAINSAVPLTTIDPLEAHVPLAGTDLENLEKKAGHLAIGPHGHRIRFDEHLFDCHHA